MKILAIDFGLRRIGFAIGSPLLETASPIEPLERKNSKQVIRHIKELVEEYDISRILVGYPFNMDGTAATITQQVEHFTTRLKKAVAPAIPVQWIDERLSSFEAGEHLKTLKQGGAKRKKLLDSMSAVIILQRFFQAADHITVPVGADGDKT